MTFTPIETQEAFEAALKERLERERSTMTKKFEGYTSPEALQKIKDEYDSKINGLNTSITENASKYADYDKQLAEKDAKISAYETNSEKMRIAHENGIPYEMASRLSGTTEEDIRKDAEALSKFIGNRGQVPPLANHEDQKGDPSKQIYLQMAKSLRGE